MIAERLVALAQEPWCFHPDRIATLTDHQIDHVYVGPAAERSEEMRKDLPDAAGPNRAPSGYRPPRAADCGPDYEPGTPGHRRQIVEQAFIGVMGMKRDAAERLYEKQLQQWFDEQQKGKS